jgi:hypothetical protein
MGISGGEDWAEACSPLRRNLRLLASEEVGAWLFVKKIDNCRLASYTE